MASRVSVELWYKIFRYINRDRATLKSVRLALPSAHGAATALLFQYLEVESRCGDPSFLQALAEGQTDLGNHIRHISLVIQKDYPKTLIARLYNAPDRGTAKLSRLLLRAASKKRFPSLRRLTISVHLRSGPTPRNDKTLRLLMERLPAHTFITLVVLDCFDEPRQAIPRRFCVFSRLQSLHLNFSLYVPQDPTRFISRLLADNLDLREFAFGAGRGYTHRFPDMMGSIFSSCGLDPKMHLRQLHTVRMKCLTISPEVVHGMMPFLHGVVNFGLYNMYNVSDALWDAFTEEKIHLRVISMHNSPVGDAFLRYASSYVDTIQEISLSWDATAINPSFGRCPMGRRFWTQVVERHASSLKKLVVNAIPLAEGGEWLMEAADMVALAACPNLKQCVISCPASTGAARLLEEIRAWSG
ncbi:hypothetical protein CPB85DRAFT_1438849 [Mucidula mucida]|nr:hypothetical protein CPB85DRAFT_1438849 [Mucidula mucida]